MMEQLRQYALTVLIGAVLCSILLSLVHRSSQESLIRLLCGVFLGILLLRPLAGRDWKLSLSLPRDISAEAAMQSSAGADMALQAESQIISRQLEAYILDKAAKHNISLTVQVILGENQLPVSAVLQGRVDEETKAALSKMIESDLGISKENQLWTG